MLDRRRFLILAAALAPATGWAAPKRRVLTVLGDSITAGYGLPANAALPRQLQGELERRKVDVMVRGAGVSGDTSAGGLARVDFSVQADTDLCLVALGGNDLLQGVDPRRTQANLDAIVSRLQVRRIAVVLAGMSAPAQLGRSYKRDFDATFAAVAKRRGVTLYPNLLSGVGQIPALNQRDGIHPNAQGVRVIAQRLAPVLAEALRARR